MAEAVRQVEVHCAERGRAVALVWNLYTAAMSATLGRFSYLTQQRLPHPSFVMQDGSVTDVRRLCQGIKAPPLVTSSAL